MPVLSLGSTHIVVHDGDTVAIVVSHYHCPAATRFITRPEVTIQAGFIVAGKGTLIPRHRHAHVTRNIVGTGEVLIVRSGRCLVSFYDPDGKPIIDPWMVTTGDIIVIPMTEYGHGFEILEDTTFIEVKNGPYTGDGERIRF